MRKQLSKKAVASGMECCVLAWRRQATRHCPRLGLNRLPAQARQPSLARNRFVSGAVIADHAPADAQCLCGGAQRQVIALHPAIEHLMADLTGLLLGPGIDVVCAKLLVKPLDTVAPLAPGRCVLVYARAQ